MDIKAYGILVFFLFFFAFAGFSQEVEKVTVTPKLNQSSTQQTKDKNQCYAYTDNTVERTKHKTLKNTGAGVGIGAVAGKIFGKAGAGAAVGGAAGAYRGHKKSKQDEKAFNETYASCLRKKGYSVEVRD